MTRRLPKKKPYHIMVFCFLWMSICYAQVPTKQFKAETYDEALYSKYASKKIFPDAIKTQVLTALSFYPELKNIKIVFRFRKRITPLSSRPRIFSVFKKKKKRTYVITISTKTNTRLAPILFSNLPYNAQIGVLGHEIGHVAYYETKSSTQLLGLTFKILNSKFVDTFEFDTDRSTIVHGLGHQLYDWSSYVRKALDITVWKGASDTDITEDASLVRQRYMNPETVKKYMALDGIYDEIK